uniref:Uncharacterized protein n=1 Tax=Aegilops tauschii subsp. strangulata TaxID=200361 RepID=A0A453BCF8_AEGTS
PAHLNTVADALSRHDADHDTDTVDTAGAVMCIRSRPSFAFIDDIRRATASSTDAQHLHQRLEAGDLEEPW